jgi:hypothetical protein
VAEKFHPARRSIWGKIRVLVTGVLRTFTALNRQEANQTKIKPNQGKSNLPKKINRGWKRMNTDKK